MSHLARKRLFIAFAVVTFVGGFAQSIADPELSVWKQLLMAAAVILWASKAQREYNLDKNESYLRELEEREFRTRLESRDPNNDNGK